MKEHIRLAAARLLISTDILSATLPPLPPRPPGGVTTTCYIAQSASLLVSQDLFTVALCYKVIASM